MRRSRALLMTAGAIALVVGLSAPSATLGTPPNFVKLLFPPQAGLNSAALTCGWHGKCTVDWTTGTALDFSRTYSDGNGKVYLRSIGFLAPGKTTKYVGYAESYVPAGTPCKEVHALMQDTAGNLLSTIRYVHTEDPWPGTVWLYANGDGYDNEQPVAFAYMTTMEKQLCIDLEYWQPPPADGVHLHETHDDTGGNSRFLLRDGGDCDATDRYTCGPQPLPYPTYVPQDWWDSWARALCINDADCDMWTDYEEDIIGTDPHDSCGGSNAWPADLNGDTRVSLADLGRFIGRFPPAPYNPRYDLQPTGRITIGDLGVMIYAMWQSCTP